MKTAEIPDKYRIQITDVICACEDDDDRIAFVWQFAREYAKAYALEACAAQREICYSHYVHKHGGWLSQEEVIIGDTIKNAPSPELK